ncbi:NAD(P)H-dependent oxidoreductase [Thalassotalea sp. Y01]|uniref:NAD(P)H-dependent oxidoreductase n=1 Tax=Thalassotalea sp. Y01 TaxID=2729613 RepID=UPI00145E2D8A|nr:NAD(P)H-dependent oxidoreductase [Thalassotalea sp. Y01]NMP15122.1 NAD(P)H-dependent oxidoreductase [Thalassotalea sp. Y01]
MTNIESLQQQIIDAFNMRHATKVFDDSKVIAEAQFTTILEAARLSPSSFGFEPYQLLVVQSPQKRELFRDFTWGANGAFNDTSGQLGTASHFVIFLAHTQVNMQHNSDYLQTFLKDVKQLPDDVIAFFNQAYQKFQEHDFKVTTDRQITDWCGKQAYIALANMMTTAALMGIDSCPIEGFEQDKTIAVLEEHFAIDPALYKPAVMAAFGYRVQDPPRGKTRRTMAQLVTWY